MTQLMFQKLLVPPIKSLLSSPLCCDPEFAVASTVQTTPRAHQGFSPLRNARAKYPAPLEVGRMERCQGQPSVPRPWVSGGSHHEAFLGETHSL